MLPWICPLTALAAYDHTTIGKTALKKRSFLLCHMYRHEKFVINKIIMPRGRRGIFRVGRKTRWRLHLG